MAAALSIALLGVSVALPVLDARKVSEVASIEATHDPGRCSTQHDHAACSKLASSHAVPGSSSLRPGAGWTTHTAGILLNETPRASVRHASTLPRAPPAIA